ncbi:hypothetical protein M758_UG311800 [Ceratodon purpureus]|nr:hypothetical protein M758_UG311800 [Ceratodon purpureus]
MMTILLPQAVDWNTDFEPIPPRRVQQSTVVSVQTRGRKKGKTLQLCTKVPPEPILPREEGCDPIGVRKPTWILHELFPLVVVAPRQVTRGMAYKIEQAWRTVFREVPVDPGASCIQTFSPTPSVPGTKGRLLRSRERPTPDTMPPQVDHVVVAAPHILQILKCIAPTELLRTAHASKLVVYM